MKTKNYLASLVVTILVLLCSCTGPDQKNATHAPKQDTLNNYRWTMLTENAAFPKGYNFQILSIRDTLWVMHHAGVWFSLDGIKWVKSPLANIVNGNAFLNYVWFKDGLYALGIFEGNAESFTFSSSISKSTDMKNWQNIAVASNLPKRFFCHPFVFMDKIWIIGGNDGSQGFDEKANYADVWNSADGVHWVKQADNVNFGKRAHSQFVFFNNKIYLLNSDVWSSTDGINWSKVTSSITGQGIFGYASVVYDNKIWLIGCNRDGVFQNQVLVSEDGKKWSTRSAPWTPRGAATACVQKNKVFMTGGKYGGFILNGQTTEFVYSNDVWMLEKKI